MLPHTWLHQKVPDGHSDTINYSCSSFLASIVFPGQISETARIVYSISSAVTYFATYPHYDLATSHKYTRFCAARSYRA